MVDHLPAFEAALAWTNAVFIALIVRIIFGRQADGEQTGSLPEEWIGRAQLELPTYPWT